MPRRTHHESLLPRPGARRSRRWRSRRRRMLSNWARSPTRRSSAYAADARQPYYESRRGAYDNGYREGLTEGERDGRRRDARPLSGQPHLAARRQGLQPLLRRRGALSAAVPDRLRRRLPGWLRPLRRLWSDGRAVPRQDTYGYPGVYGNSYPDRGRIPIDRVQYPAATAATATARRIRTG